MKIHFKISYFTVWGQQLLVTGNIPELGNGDYSKALKLSFQNAEDWIGQVDVKSELQTAIEYSYLLYNEKNGMYTEEW